MACMGPSYEFAEQQAEEAYKKVMALLKEEYQIENWSFPEPFGPGDGIATAMHNLSKKNAREWDEKADDLKKALVELIWHQHCMDF